MKKRGICLFFLYVACLCFAIGTSPIPVISDLTSENYMFQQYCDDVRYARKALAAGTPHSQLPIRFYRYTAKKNDTILQIAARCSIPYDALITLNSIESVKTVLAGKNLLLPILPGLYVPEHPVSNTECLVDALTKKSSIKSIPVKLAANKGKQKTVYHCYPNALLDGTIRNFFLTPFYCFPLKNAVVTSPFGMRKNPFTGKLRHHAGIDLAAPAGSPVYACAPGQIIKAGYSAVYGNYILLRHTDGRESLYGHLSVIKKHLYEKVKSSTIIGSVGSTGLSTGPHLHFEIREQGQAKNPALFINTPKKRK